MSLEKFGMVSYRFFCLVYVMKKELYKSRREFICLRDQFSKVCEFLNKKALLALPGPYVHEYFKPVIQ